MATREAARRVDQADALEDVGATAVTVESRAALAATAARRVAASAKVVGWATAEQTGVAATWSVGRRNRDRWILSSTPADAEGVSYPRP